MNKIKKINTLHVDVEGGWGGSSRSLFELVSRLDKSIYNPIVIHRQTGPVQQKYQKLGIKTYHIPEVWSFVPRKKNSWKILLVNIPSLLVSWIGNRKVLRVIREENVDIIHLNYEGFFLLANYLRKRTDKPIFYHIRTLIPLNTWGKVFVRIISKVTHELFFISDMEQKHFNLLNNKKTNSQVMWNIIPKTEIIKPSHSSNQVIFLGNVSYKKGADRMNDLAKELEGSELFIKVFGVERGGEVGFLDKIKNEAIQRGLQNKIEYCGHTSSPEYEISKSFALIRPSRDNDPWGRDVIESSSFGLPVLATGTFEGVIKNDVNGYLFETFDAKSVANKLKELKREQKKWESLSHNGMEQGKEKFAGKNQLQQFHNVSLKYLN